MAHSIPETWQVVSTLLIEAGGCQAEEREGIPKEEVSFFICTNTWVNNTSAIFYALHCLSTRQKIPKYTNQGLVSSYRPTCISFSASPINISLGGRLGNENQHRYVLVLLNFLTPLCGFSLGICYYSFKWCFLTGFGSAWDPKSLSPWCSSCLWDVSCNTAMPAAFPAQSGGLLGLFSASQKHSLEKSQGPDCQHTWYSSSNCKRANTYSFACFDYFPNER